MELPQISFEGLIVRIAQAIFARFFRRAENEEILFDKDPKQFSVAKI